MKAWESSKGQGMDTCLVFGYEVIKLLGPNTK